MNFIKRVVFYSSQLIVQQGEPGEEWDYDIKPVYIISLTDFELFADQELVHRATICNIDSGALLIDSLNYTFIELPKLKELECYSDDLKKWIYLFKNLNKLESLPETFQEEKFTRLLSYAKVAKFTKNELKLYEKDMQFKWDKYAEEQYTKTQIEKEVKEGIEKGIKEAIEQGIEQGALNAKREMAKALKEQGFRIEAIVKASSLSEEEIKSL